MRLIWAISLILLATAVSANAPRTSLRPQARPLALSVAGSVVASVGASTAAPAPIGLLRSLRPVARPGWIMAARPKPVLPVVDRPKAKPPIAKPPVARPPKLSRREQRQQKRLLKKGAVCGDIDIQGALAGDIAGKLVGCGVADAVRVRSVSGVALSQQSVMDCNTARTLKHWIENDMAPALRRKGGGVAQIKVAAHYSCRTRNNRRGAKISEHGKGKAIDISGFTLRDGTKITVLKHYGSRKYGAAMRKMRKGACGRFGTVLGPGSDRYHKDHFHFDTARHRGGAYCR